MPRCSQMTWQPRNWKQQLFNSPPHKYSHRGASPGPEEDTRTGLQHYCWLTESPYPQALKHLETALRQSCTLLQGWSLGLPLPPPPRESNLGKFRARIAILEQSLRLGIGPPAHHKTKSSRIHRTLYMWFTRKIKYNCNSKYSTKHWKYQQGSPLPPASPLRWRLKSEIFRTISRIQADFNIKKQYILFW